MFTSASKFGTFLVREGKLTPKKLDQVLEMQALVGNRLGTNILDRQLMEESALLAALGQYLQTQTASADQLRKIPREVLKLVPPKLARRYQVVPIEQRGKTLILASTDPGDALVEDEVGMLNGCLARTVVALEMRVHAALARFYRVPCPGRLAGLYRRYELAAMKAATAASRRETPRRETPAPPSPETPSPETPSPATPSPISRTPPPRPDARPAPIEPPAPLETAAATPAAREPAPTAAQARDQQAPEEPELQYIELDSESLSKLYGRPTAGVEAAPAGRPAAAETAPPKTAVPVLVEAPAAPSAQVPAEAEHELLPLAEDEGEGTAAWPTDPEERLDAAAAELQQTEIRDEIGDVLLAFGEPFLKRRLLLIRRKDEIVGWRGEGEGVELDKVREVAIGAQEPSVFLGLTQADSFWLGPLPFLPANRKLHDALGVSPSACIVLPVVLRSRVVCFLYGDNLGDGVSGAPMTQLKRLVGKAGLAFEVYILRNKIRLL